jgi:signal recognition particle subunit SRP19
MDEEKAWVLWPEYFDSNRTRDQGRKVRKELSVPDPSLEMLGKALQRLGLEYKVEEAKSYPGNWYKSQGRVLVDRKLPKSQLLMKVAEQLLKVQRS